MSLLLNDEEAITEFFQNKDKAKSPLGVVKYH